MMSSCRFQRPYPGSRVGSLSLVQSMGEKARDTMRTSFCKIATIVLAAHLMGASGTNLHAGTFSDANWASLGGFPGANGSVRATAVDGSGNLYIGGSFTVVGDVFANSVAKWNGTNWSALGLGVNSWVYALAVSGSDLYAAG